MNFPYVVQSLLNGLTPRSYAALNFHSPDRAAQQELITCLTTRLGRDLISVDVSETVTFTALAGLLLSRLSSDGTEPCDGDLLMAVEDRLEDLSDDDEWFCLLLTNFDATDANWDDGAFSLLRAWIDRGLIPACVLISDQSLIHITKKPAGSSAFSNIFRCVRIDEV